MWYLFAAPLVHAKDRPDARRIIQFALVQYMRPVAALGYKPEPELGCLSSSSWSHSSALLSLPDGILLFVRHTRRLVPIELPTRRRRVFRIVAVTGSISACVVVRAILLLWAIDKDISIDDDVSASCALYFKKSALASVRGQWSARRKELS